MLHRWCVWLGSAGLFFAWALLLAALPTAEADASEQYTRVLQEVADHFGLGVRVTRIGGPDEDYQLSATSQGEKLHGAKLTCMVFRDAESKRAFMALVNVMGKAAKEVATSGVPTTKKTTRVLEGVEVEETDTPAFTHTSPVMKVEMPRMRAMRVQVTPLVAFGVATGGGRSPAPYMTYMLKRLKNAGLLGPVVEGVSFVLHAEKAGYLPVSRRLDTQDFAPSSITATGRVVDAKGDPIVDARVSIPSLKLTTTTDAQGAFRLHTKTKGTKPFSPALTLTLAQPTAGTTVTFEHPDVLPVPGSATIKILARDGQGKPVPGAKVRLRWTLPPYVKAPTSAGVLDKQGTLGVALRIETPSGLDALAAVPASFHVEVEAEVVPKDGGQAAKATLKVGVNLALIAGTTVGPDMKPREETHAPSVKGVSQKMFVANWKDGSGAFRVLVRPRHPQTKAVPKDWALAWSEDDRLPLNYPLASAPQGGQILDVGVVDVLTPAEHIKRMRDVLSSFCAAMALTTAERTRIQGAIQRLVFRDGSTQAVPLYSDNYTNDSGVISTPGDAKLYWGNNLRETDDPSYQIIPHELGHFVHHHLIERHAFIHACYNKLSTGEHTTWKVPGVARFKAPYLTFSESAADFFAIVFRNFWQSKHPEIKASPYFKRLGYLPEFETDEKAMAVVSGGTAGYLVEGVQTRYLAAFYGGAVKTRPAAVYNDYLNTMLLHVDRPKGWLGTLINRPARTIYEWLLTKDRVPSMLGLGNALAVATRYRLLPNVVPAPTAAPAYRQKLGELYVDRKRVDFKAFPVTLLGFRTRIRAARGMFNIDMSDAKAVHTATIRAPTVIVLLSRTEIEVIRGRVGVDFPVTLVTPGGTIKPKGTVVQIEVDYAGTTRVDTLHGVVEITSRTGTALVLEAGRSVSLDAAGVLSATTACDAEILAAALLPDVALPPMPEAPAGRAGDPPRVETPEAGVAGWALVGGALVVLLLLATRLAFPRALLGALLVGPLMTVTVVALGQLALPEGAGTGEASVLAALLLSPWTVWQSAQVWLPAVAWVAGGLTGGLIMGGPLRALVAGLLLPLAPWILIHQPRFESYSVDVQGFEEVFETLASGAPQDLLAVGAASLLGALFGGLMLPGRRKN